MDAELARAVVTAITALSGMINAYRSQAESSQVLAEQEPTALTPSSTDPWRWRAETVLVSAEKIDQIVSNAEASPETGRVLAALVPEDVLREVLEHIDAEIGRLHGSISDSSRSKARRGRDLDHAEGEICAQLTTIKTHCKNAIPDLPQRALAGLWQHHRCS